MRIVKYVDVESRIIQIRKQSVIIDVDVAQLYSVTTKRINEAVSRNLAKFPEGYLVELTDREKAALVANCDRFNTLKHATVQPKAFTERGLYMLATILKSPVAIQTTIAIIDTFAQLKELTQSVYKFAAAPTKARKVKIFENTTEIIADLLDNELIVSQQETELKFKLPFFEITKKITKVKKSKAE